MKKEQAKEYKKFIEKIRNKKMFALARFADGEQMFIESKGGRGIDGWSAPGKTSKLGTDLEGSLILGSSNGCYVGISDDTTNQRSKLFYMNKMPNIDSEKVTMSNIFVGGTYEMFTVDILNLMNSRNVVIVCSYRADIKNIVKYFKNAQVILGPADCSSFWERSSEKWLKEMHADIKGKKGYYYLFALGPISSVTIPRLWDRNKDNTYIDIGSSLDPILFGRATRPYHLSGHKDSKLLVELEVQDNIEDKEKGISCILNCYKRWDLIEEWLTAVESQSESVDEIHILFNTNPPNNIIEFLREKEGVTNIVVSDKNLGVWNRFAYAFNCKSKYVCIFDDDTIPGKRWIENCLII